MPEARDTHLGIGSGVSKLVLLIGRWVVGGAVCLSLLPKVFLHQVIEVGVICEQCLCQWLACPFLAFDIVRAEGLYTDGNVFGSFSIRELPPHALALCEMDKLPGCCGGYPAGMLDLDPSLEDQHPPAGTSNFIAYFGPDLRVEGHVNRASHGEDGQFNA